MPLPTYKTWKLRLFARSKILNDTNFCWHQHWLSDLYGQWCGLLYYVDIVENVFTVSAAVGTTFTSMERNSKKKNIFINAMSTLYTLMLANSIGHCCTQEHYKFTCYSKNLFWLFSHKKTLKLIFSLFLVSSRFSVFISLSFLFRYI